MLLALANSATVVGNLQDGVSEYPTWTFLPLLFTMLFASRSTRAWLWGTALLGLSLLTRLNHAPALLALFALFLFGVYRVRPRPAAAAVGLLAAVTLLPAAHNLYYGGTLELLPTSAAIPVNLVFPPARLLALGNDPEVSTLAWAQVQGILQLTPPWDPLFQAMLRGLQVAWLCLVALSVARGRAAARTTLLLLIPLLYLGVHVFYFVGEPRHVVAGYLATGTVVLYAAARGEAGSARRRGLA